jgi:putative ATPase
MLAAGEDPRFIARRMVVMASEDVGLADRLALPTAVAAFDALDKVGLPEAEFALTHAAITLATAPKSNTVTIAIARAKRAVEDRGDLEVPAHLRDAHYAGARRLGHGVGYDYPHDAAQGHVVQQYLPDGLTGWHAYAPGPHGHEAGVADRLRRWWPDRYGPAPTDDQDD